MSNDAEQIFHAARARPPMERAAYLDEACLGDAALRRQVEALLNADARAGDFLKSAEIPDQVVDATIAQSDGPGTAQRRPPAEQPGQVIGRYKLLERIGEGGFGSVWAAEQREPVKRRVALKIIKLGMDTKQVIARFEAERQALAMMDHPNIAKVLDAGSTETGRPYFVMELVKGVPILDYCDTEKLDTKARLDLFMKVCHAIQHAHQKGIIHRDIKPSNVLVTLHDGVPIPKVIDFGIAKATNQELTEKTLYTQHRQMIGTPAYMSPEQAEMSGLDIDTRSDIYSLGVLLYELLTGTTPFATEELMSRGYAEMMRIIREVEPHKPSTRLSTLGEKATRTAQQRHAADVKKLGLILKGDLDWIVMKCLEKDRSRRYETANGLAMDILRHLRDEPVVAGPPSASYRFRKFVKRNKGQVIAASLVGAMLVLGIVGTSSGMAWALREKDRADTAATNATLAAQAEEKARIEAEANEQKAIEEGERAERELVRATEIKRLITEMLTSVSPEEAQGADTTLLKGILDDAAERLSKGEVADELIAGELHKLVGDVYMTLGQYLQAEAHLLIAKEISKRVLGEENPNTLASTNSLAILYSQQGRYAEAEALLIKSLEIAGPLLGDEHPDTLSLMNNLALLYSDWGRYAEAEPLLLKNLEITKRLLGDEHPDTLKSMHNLAGLYFHQDRFAEAETLYLETLKIRRSALGEEHLDTLKNMQNLALLYCRQGRHAEAEALFLKTLMKQKLVLGERHPDTLISKNNLAVLYLNQKRYAEAEPLFLEVLDIQKHVLTNEHPATLGTITNLGNLYNLMGRYDEAAAMFETSLPIKRRVLTMQHPWTGYAMQGLATAYEALGRHDDALSLRREMLNLQTDAADAPDASPNALNAAAWTLLTHNIEQLHDPARALAYAQRACEIEGANGGNDLWMYLDTLALAQHLTGDTASALETQKRAIALMPPTADQATRDQFDAALKSFEEALAVMPGADRSDR